MTECRMTKEFRNDETPRGVIRILDLRHSFILHPSSFVIRISIFARVGGEKSRLRLA
jgi:hypothetical protein